MAPSMINRCEVTSAITKKAVGEGEKKVDRWAFYLKKEKTMAINQSCDEFPIKADS